MNRFELARPDSLAETVELLSGAERPRSVALLAGGQDLVTEMAEHLVEPDLVVDLKTVPGMRELAWTADGGLTIGALVTLERLVDDADVRERLTVLAEAAESVASPQIRAVGTVGGNLNQRPRCWYFRNEHAVCLKKGGVACLAAVGRNKYNAILGGGPSYIVHPSDLAPALVALGAEVELTGPEGTRRMPAQSYFVLPRNGGILTETARGDDEVLTAVHVPPQPAGQRSTYMKFKERESYDWALSSVALALNLEGSEVARARVVLGGVAPIPWRAPGAERVLEGAQVSEETIAKACDAALFGAQPLAENGYKIPLTKGLLTRALRKLA
jgi:xanthine dehydrogenase YagS FAD-binding subunit